MVSILQLPPPTDAASDAAWAVRADARLWRDEESAVFGNDDLSDTDESAVAGATPSSFRRRMQWVALLDPADQASVAGSATVDLPLRDNLGQAIWQIVVAAEHRRRGIGAQLLTAVEEYAANQGRTVLQTYSTQRGDTDPDAADALIPASGSGIMSAEHPTARFLRAHGYRLEQVEVHSVLSVPVSEAVLGPLEADARLHAEGDYRLVTWQDRCPDELVDAFAELRTAMLDAPSAGMEVEREQWDADRVREVERRAGERGVLALTVAAQHVGSGALAGYTQLMRFAAKPEGIFQEDTVVEAAHRGHRLGMWLKVANLRQLAQRWPQALRVHTWNADENDHMLAINRALGFRPESAEGAWQKRL